MNFADALARLKEHSAAGRLDAAWGALRCAMFEPFKVLDIQKLNRVLTTDAGAWREFTRGRTLRIALLGGFTTQPIKELLLPIALACGHWAEIYEAPYNTFETEPLDAGSPLYQFQPDIVLLATGAVSLSSWPEPGAEVGRIEALVEGVIIAHRQRWAAIEKNAKARIIQHNFDLPPALLLGRLEGRLAWSATNFIQRLNTRLWEHDGREVHVLDIHQIAADCGRRHWLEPRWQHHSKHGFDPGLIHHYGRALAGLFRAMLGGNRKCLVTDLDNTLWGGVIGDDGLDGIELGNVSAIGEAYAAFGRYLKSLRQLGVVLAVNSKNEVKVATEVFTCHPESPLKLDDFAAFVCNWESKSENLRTIARRLNLGLDSLVFVDDNPAECEEVRATLPEVAVIEMSCDPAYFPRRIEELHLFTPLDFTAEDFVRAQSYLAQKQFAESGASVAGLEAHLAGLEMEAVVLPAQPGDLARLEQLFRKTNQFNFTGRVYDRSALERMLATPDALVLSAWLKDRIAQHGLVSALVARIDADALVLDNWVMSCRVFTRTFEQCVFGCLLELARLRGCIRICGEFIPTPKNGYVQPLFEKLGFRQAGAGKYELALATAAPPVTFVKQAL
jgi:FkbH-like protein